MQIPLSGNPAFVSQSGAIGTAILDYSIRERFGFSHFISVSAIDFSVR
jgi:acetyltransferase